MSEPVGTINTEDVSAAIGRPVARVRRRNWEYHSSHSMQELDVEFVDGSACEMIFKNLAPRMQLEEAARTRPQFLYEPRREIEVYRDLLATAELDTPTYYGSKIDERSDEPCYWLFLERMRDAVPLWQCELDQWPAAARWLKRLHQKKILTLPGSLIRYDENFYWQWMERAAKFRPETRAIARNYSKVVERLTKLPATFIHGEFYPSNILLQNGRIRPVDWETAAIGPALMDLAALCAGRFDDTRRREIAQAYGAEMSALDDCRLHLAIQWLGWSNDWTPPKEHAQNWLAEALELAAKVGAQ
jgi:hypothetical protein